jgi:hypothetical protein
MDITRMDFLKEYSWVPDKAMAEWQSGEYGGGTLQPLHVVYCGNISPFGNVSGRVGKALQPPRSLSSQTLITKSANYIWGHSSWAANCRSVSQEIPWIYGTRKITTAHLWTLSRANWTLTIHSHPTPQYLLSINKSRISVSQTPVPNIIYSIQY